MNSRQFSAAHIWGHNGRRKDIWLFCARWCCSSTHSIHVSDEMFENRLRSCRLRPVRSPDLNPYNFHLWGNLKTKYSYNPYTYYIMWNNYIHGGQWCQTSVSHVKRLLSLFQSRKETFWTFTMMVNLFKQFIYFKKWTSVFIICSILVRVLELFFWVDGG